MKKVRLGIIGLGGIGKHHLGNMDKLEGAELTAICDIAPEPLQKALEKHKVKAYDNHRALLKDGACDAVIIATPHYFHPPIAMDAFRKGLHVLSEKPIAVHTLAAKKAIAAHKRHPDLVYAAMFQQRTVPVYRKARQLIVEGELGEIRRVTCIATAWFRSQAYYDSGGWRATWGGEGGGVLLNQCPHTLDMMTWLTGVPRRVTASISLGKYHKIEVEDEVNALLEYDNGAIGHFCTSTGEAPGTDRLEIAGDRGLMIVEGGRMLLRRTASSVQHYLETTPELFKTPQFQDDEIRVERQMRGAHLCVAQNFVNAILRGEKLIAPAAEGLKGLALGNAMMLSGFKKRPVEIPFDDREYAAIIEDLARKSTYKKQTRKTAEADVKDSFH